VGRKHLETDRRRFEGRARRSPRDPWASAICTIRSAPTLESAPNEWYKWTVDLRTNRDIQILLSVDPSSFPLGTGPKPHEIWRSGYYPVVWTHRKYRMVYFNMGHNDMDFSAKPNTPLSSTFESPDQNRLLLNALLWLGTGKDGGMGSKW
jgi:uncharacterized protein